METGETPSLGPSCCFARLILSFALHLANLYVTRFAKRVLYMHSFKTHFLSPSVSCSNAPTGYVFTTAES